MKVEIPLTGQRRLQRFGPGLAVLLAVVAPVLLLIPIQIHSDNIYDIGVGLHQILPSLLTMVALVAGLGLGLLLVLPRRWYRLLMAIATGLAVMVWIQGQILVWDYGVLDGREIEWWSLPGRALIDTLLWVVVLVFVVVARKRVVAHAGLIAFSLLLIQGLPTAWLMLDYPDSPEFHDYSFDERQKFSFSDEQNVIFIILDAFQVDIFQKLLYEDPRLGENLDGFTYFRNAVSGYSKTYPSIALMMSGQWFDNTQPIQQFVKQSFLSQSIPLELRKLNWQVDLFPFIERVVHVSPKVASNVVGGIECHDMIAESGKLMDLGAFRSSPHWLKPLWLNNHRWQMGRYLTEICKESSFPDPSGAELHNLQAPEHSALRFLFEANMQGDDALQSRSFKFYHLMVPHAPFQIDRNLEVTRLPSDNEGFIEQLRGTLKLLKQFLDCLRQLGVYDNSVIVVVSDHGGGRYTSAVNLDNLDLDDIDELKQTGNIPGHHHSAGLPLVLIKPAFENAELQISDAPVSLGDIARTISELLELELPLPGRNMFTIADDEQRIRKYYYYEFSGWSRDYLPDMIEYKVEGFSWLDRHWHATGRVFSSAAPEAAMVPVFELGEDIHFRPGSPFKRALVRGWSDPQSNGLVWSRSSEAVIELIPGEPIQGPIRVQLDFLPYTAGGQIVEPTIEIVVNDELRHTWSSDTRGWHEVQVPAEIVNQSGRLQFRLHFPDAASPFDYGRSLDARKLGIALHGIRIGYPET